VIAIIYAHVSPAIRGEPIARFPVQSLPVGDRFRRAGRTQAPSGAYLLYGFDASPISYSLLAWNRYIAKASHAAKGLFGPEYVFLKAFERGPDTVKLVELGNPSSQYGCPTGVSVLGQMRFQGTQECFVSAQATQGLPRHMILQFARLTAFSSGEVSPISMKSIQTPLGKILARPSPISDATKNQSTVGVIARTRTGAIAAAQLVCRAADSSRIHVRNGGSSTSVRHRLNVPVLIISVRLIQHGPLLQPVSFDRAVASLPKSSYAYLIVRFAGTPLPIVLVLFTLLTVPIAFHVTVSVW
jgi:hypothetical protein